MMQDYGKRREAQPNNQAREKELRLNHLQSADLRVCAFVLLAVAIQPAIAHWHGLIAFTSVHFHALKAINLSASCQEKAIFALKKLLAKGG